MNSSARPANQPLLSLEGLRLVSSLAIMLTHFAPYAMGKEPFGGGLTIFVDLFFVISGIVITSAYGDRINGWRQFGLYLQRRFARLYPLHFATMMIYVAIAVAAAQGLLQVRNPDRYAISQLPLYFSLTQAWFGNGGIAWNGVSWSISAELAVYLLFPLILFGVGKRKTAGFLLVILLLLCCASAAQVVIGIPLVKLVSRFSWLRAIPSFTFGVWLASNRNLLEKTPSDCSSALLVLSWLALVYLLAFLHEGLLRLISVWLIVASAYVCDLRKLTTPFSSKVISAQGRLTYSLYLIHPVVATIWLAAIAPKLFGTSTIGMWAAVVVALVLTYVLSEVSFRFFEEPLRKWLGRSWFDVPNASRGALN